jgi:hypothetical protein
VKARVAAIDDRVIARGGDNAATRASSVAAPTAPTSSAVRIVSAFLSNATT